MRRCFDVQPVDFTVRRPLAAMLLCLVTSAGAFTGCLLPQDDQVLGALPSRKNLPPLIAGGRKPVQQNTTVFLGPNCNDPEFTISVDDDSPTISDKWFIDPTSSHAVTENNPGWIGNGATGVAGKERTLNAPGSLLYGLRALGETTKPVEVVITDGRFGENPATHALEYNVTETGTNELGQVVDQKVYHTSYSWFVTVSLAACP